MNKIKMSLYILLSAMAVACSSGNDVIDPEPDPNPNPDPTPDPTPTLVSEGWPRDYAGVMLQGFSWDSYDNSQWKVLEKQADDMKGYIDLIWVPQSGKCLETYQVMGYTPYFYFNQNSSFGSESELRSMIKTLKDNRIGTIADVVINHHNTDGWFSFPKETYNGVVYQLQSTDICSNDDGGATLAQAKSEGVSLSKNADEGEDWGGMRDLDHKSENVQKVMKAYVDFLKNDLGYSGFRYDMVKGFSGTHVADYNDAVGIEYSVGEYWDSNEKITDWINSTNKKSAAFDFQFRYNVRDAINGNNWTKLNSVYNLMHDATLRRYAVTFVENHDTQYRSASEPLDPIKKDTLAANAYMLAMPGTPCIFQPHWIAYKPELKAMISVRKLAGITNMSNYANRKSQKDLYANEVTGNEHRLLVAVGNNASTYEGITGFTRVLSGYHYAYFLSNDAETAWSSTPSGTYENSFTTTLAAVSAINGAKVVYTLDGKEPTAESESAESGKQITINESCTMKVGLLVNGVVKNVTTYQYTVEKFNAYTFTVYVNADAVNWSPFYFYTWSNNTKNASADWPGDKMTATKTIGGKTWYYNEYVIDKSTDIVNFVFGNGKGKPQTVDVTSVNSTSFFEITSEKDGEKYKVKDVTSSYSE